MKKYILAIVVVLLIVFLSQQQFARAMVSNLFAKAVSPIQPILTKGANWAKQEILPKITGEAQKRGEMVKKAADDAQQKVSESISDKIKNYISGVEQSIVNPGAVKNCNCTCPTTAPAK